MITACGEMCSGQDSTLGIPRDLVDRDVLGLTVPCSTVPSCFARSSFDSIAILHISASTGVR